MSEHTFLKHAAMAVGAVLAAVGLAGCVTTVPVSVRAPGEINLSGVSKLAILDFNSVSDKPGEGIYGVDVDTLALVEGHVAAAFAQNKCYSIARLDAEQAILDKESSIRAPSSRYDGFLYGRVWWQVSPELQGTYPQVFRLKSWNNVPYQVTDAEGKVKTKVQPHVLTRTHEEVVMCPFRAWNATLMLSLTIYRVEKDGTIARLTDTFAIASQKYTVANGSLFKTYAPIGAYRASRVDAMRRSEGGLLTDLFGVAANDVTGAFRPIQRTVSIPTDLEARIELTSRLASELVNRVSPHAETFNVEVSGPGKACVKDRKLVYMLKDGAYKAVTQYANDLLAEKASKAVAGEVAALADADASDSKSYEAVIAEISVSSETRKYIEENAQYFFAKAVAAEASGDFRTALSGYRFLLHFVPSRVYAQGINRCLFALDMARDVRKVDRDRRKAKGRAALQ